ncbi:GntR family transcriptional regulator [Pararhodobacter sp. CCB-MM2]|uniref:GntR family transcriptional regulator n=1 Tax=Pararhodobacter sp. CCB-MM2 TaxID=1786003 RepID=UPI00082C3FBF|nr:GntR family transcriptional regulator [Pararhodobacter sp. CCB-MM2]
MTIKATSGIQALSRDDLTLSGRLVTAVRDAILRGDLAPGEHLKEKELCDMFQVSRGLLREAVQKLAGEGLLVSVPHKGLQVWAPDRRAAQELYSVRGVLEGLIAAEFARNANESSRSDLFAIFETIRALPLESTAQELVEAKNRFYRCLLDGCGNRVAAQTFTQLNNRIVMLRRLTLSQPGRLPQMIAEIDAIITAIRDRDPETARRMTEEHVRLAAAVVDLRFDELETPA